METDRKKRDKEEVAEKINTYSGRREKKIIKYVRKFVYKKNRHA